MAPNKISFTEGKINVPDNPIIPFIEGDGIGVDIWPASKHVFDSAVEKAYDGKRKIEWKEVLAWAIPLHTFISFVSFQYKYARIDFVPAPSACITLQ